MLGFRGCRLIGYPEISAMQARAVFEAAAMVQKEGIKVRPEIMIPLVGSRRSWTCRSKSSTRRRARCRGQKVKLSYMVGTMIRSRAAR